MTRAVRDTTLARIVHLVEARAGANARRRSSSSIASRAGTRRPWCCRGRWWSSCRCWPWACRLATWAYRALVLLVVACPCALVISTPVSIVAALATAARHGVLIKGGAHLERLAGVRVRGVRQDRHAHRSASRPS